LKLDPKVVNKNTEVGRRNCSPHFHNIADIRIS
jgi:hypothetical protein